ncbi:hypothetical protein E3N88_14528 [Mikania micrantha]|uniref:Retrotransposon gag domain-containing protein n=1 Tax=Mikania micrantha TaxID=192012 RepID=A0A5N6P2Y6_9ASTR|nr:hypothetical protein E3N88_14528 [Mikania micrantha]
MGRTQKSLVHVCAKKKTDRHFLMKCIRENKRLSHLGGNEEEKIGSSGEFSRNDMLHRIGKIDFPKFDGNEVDNWIYRYEHFFSVDDTPENFKVCYAVIHLEGNDVKWHQSILKMKAVPITDITWKTYSEAIVARFSTTLFEDAMGMLTSLSQSGPLEEFCQQFDACLLKVSIPEPYASQLLESKSCNEDIKSKLERLTIEKDGVCMEMECKILQIEEENKELVLAVKILKDSQIQEAVNSSLITELLQNKFNTLDEIYKGKEAEWTSRDNKVIMLLLVTMSIHTVVRIVLLSSKFKGDNDIYPRVSLYPNNSFELGEDVKYPPAEITWNPQLVEDGTIWAILISGGSGLGDYALQEHIIVLVKDDITNHHENPEPEIIRPFLTGPDVYRGVPKAISMLNDEVIRIEAQKGSTTTVLAAPLAPTQQQPQASDPATFSSHGRGRGWGLGTNEAEGPQF